MTSEKHRRSALINIKKAQIKAAQKVLTENKHLVAIDDTIETKKNPYYIKYYSLLDRYEMVKRQRNEARMMVDILLKTIRNILPKYWHGFRPSKTDRVVEWEK